MKRFLRHCFLFVLLATLTVPGQAQLFFRRDSTAHHLADKNRQLKEAVDSLEAELARIREELARSRAEAQKAEEAEKPVRHPAPQLEANPYDPAVTDSLLSIWYLQRQVHLHREEIDADLDAHSLTSNIPDEVYIQRLKDMHSFVTLPYNETVRSQIIRYTERMRGSVPYILGLARYYLPIFEETFHRYGLPEELKALAIVESALDPTAVSRAGATGIWQFMHATAKSYGLHIDSFVDERMDAVKAADAAARYLKNAYRVFGDWSLAISSYNCGPGNVSKAITRCGGRSDFWAVYEFLPSETRGYMPAFVGALYLLHYFPEHGIRPAPMQMPVQVDTFHVRKMTHFRQVEALAGVPLGTLGRLNPQYVHDIIPGSDSQMWVLRIPYNYARAYLAHEDSIPAYKAAEMFKPVDIETAPEDGAEGWITRTTRIRYKIRKGDNLGKIAAKHHVTVAQLKEWNHLRGTAIRAGNTLIIQKKTRVYIPPKPKPAPPEPAPADSQKQAAPNAAAPDSTLQQTAAQPLPAAADSSARAQEQPPVPQAGEQKTYTVQQGDSVYGIARRFGVSMDALRAANNMSDNYLRPGMVLVIPEP